MPGAHGPKTVKGAQSDPNYVSRLLARSEYLLGGPKIIVTPLSRPVAPPGFCNGGSEVWVYRGSRVRSPPVPFVLSLYQRGSTALQCICRVIRRSSMTTKAHTYYIIFGRPPLEGEASPFPPGGATGQGSKLSITSVTLCFEITPPCSVQQHRHHLRRYLS